VSLHVLATIATLTINNNNNNKRFGHCTGQPVLAVTLTYKLEEFSRASFTAHYPLPTEQQMHSEETEDVSILLSCIIGTI